MAAQRPGLTQALESTDVRSLLLFSLISSFCLSSYATEPSQSTTARLRLATDTPHVASVYQYSDASCSANERKLFGLRAGMLFRSKESRLGIPLWNFHKNGAKEIEIPSGKFFGKFEGVADGGSVGAKCAAGFSLDAQPGHDYEVFFDFPGGGCSIKIAEIAGASTGNPQRIELEQSEQLGPDCSKRKFRL